MISIKEELLKKYLATQNLSNILIAASDKKTFVYYGTNTNVVVKLYADRIEFFYQTHKNVSDLQPNFILFMKDVAGSIVVQDNVNTNTNEVFWTVYAYPKEKYLSQPQSKRKSQIIKLKCTQFDNFVKNLNLANEWHTNLHFLILNESIKNENRESNEKPFLFYVNPKAGAGKAQKIYNSQILPVLTEANVPHTLVLTSKKFRFKHKIHYT